MSGLTNQSLSVLQHIVGTAVDGDWGPLSQECARAKFPMLFDQAHPTQEDFQGASGMHTDGNGNPDWSRWFELHLEAMNELPGVHITDIRRPFGKYGVRGVSGQLVIKGVCMHYTGSTHGDPTCREHYMALGDEDLSGPLYMFVTNNDGSASFITNGRTHNAGKGEFVLLDKVESGLLAKQPRAKMQPVGEYVANGNTAYMGISADGKPGQFGYEQNLRNAMAIAACILLALQSETATVVGHSEHKASKSDPVAWDEMPATRATVHEWARILGNYGKPEPRPDDIGFTCQCGRRYRIAVEEIK